MPKLTQAKSHLTEQEIQEKIKTTVGFWRVRRWLIILHALKDPSPAADMAKRFGVGKQTVSNLISSYNRKGVEAVEVAGRGQRQRAYLSMEEEKEFLSSFKEEAEKGTIVTVSEIQTALERHLGKKVHETTVYRLLKRNGWRKIAPRPTHVKHNKEIQEAFKKKTSKTK